MLTELCAAYLHYFHVQNKHYSRFFPTHCELCSVCLCVHWEVPFDIQTVWKRDEDQYTQENPSSNQDWWRLSVFFLPKVSDSVCIFLCACGPGAVDSTLGGVLFGLCGWLLIVSLYPNPTLPSPMSMSVVRHMP